MTRVSTVPRPPNKTSDKRTGRRGVRGCSITLLLTLCLLLAALFAPRILANRYRSQLGSIPDQRAAALVDKVARLGKPGIPVLAEALGSPREPVAKAAGRSLREEMDRWISLPTSKSSPRLQLLAKALADQVDRYGPTSRTEAAELVREILRRPLDGDFVDRSAVAAACGTVLEATRLERRLAARGELSSDTEHTNVGGESPGLQRTAIGPDPLSSFPEPGRIVPDQPHSAPLTKPTQSEARPTPSQLPALDQPRRIFQGEIATAMPKFARQTPPADQDDDGWQALPDRWEPGHVRQPEALPPREDIATIDTVDLMRRLQSSDQWTVDQAQGELTRRGFTPMHLDLAGRLFDPDPQIRKQLLQLLPTILNLDATPWLIELSRDVDPQVRLDAITLMATSGEPTLMSQLRQISESDPDLTVRRRAGEILR